MNKKTYQMPTMRVVIMRGKTRLMAGSVEGNAITGGSKGSGRGRAAAMGPFDGIEDGDW